MKKHFLFLVFLLVATFVNAQSYKVSLNATLTDNVKKLKKGSEVTISRVIQNVELTSYNNWETKYFIAMGNDTILYTEHLSDRLDFKYDDIQDFWDAQIIKNVLGNLTSNGLQESLRSEMEDEALSFINKQKEYGMVFNDPYMESYIYSIVSKIAPKTLIDARPGNVNLLILENPTMNASMYSNGTLVINTGLLSALHTEDELAAVLAHEIAHFILDHSVQNVNAAISRKKRAEFWAGVATGLTAIAEGVAAVKTNYYIPGAATVGMAVLSSSIANQVVDRLGMKYNYEQEEAADKAAVEALKILGYNPNALASALNRMTEVMKQERSHEMYFQSYTHPALIDRINNIGKPQDIASSDFEKEISFAVTSTARMKFEDRRFRQALPLVEQNIINGVATAEDYILKANCLLALHNEVSTNNEALDAINSAKNIDESNINIYKAEIIANLRLKKHTIAQNLLEQYVLKLNEMELSLQIIESDNTWDYTHKFIKSEKDWARRMQIKVKAML